MWRYTVLNRRAIFVSVYNPAFSGKREMSPRFNVPSPASRATMLDRLRRVVGEALHLGGRESELDVDTPLLGNIPELDSMAVLTVISALEEHFHFVVADDDDIAQAFETMGSLMDYVEEKTRA